MCLKMLNDPSRRACVCGFLIGRQFAVASELICLRASERVKERDEAS
jgi:hypothetical protein